MNNIRETVLKIVAEELDAKPENLKDADLLHQQVFGPFDIARIILRLEEALKTEIPEADETGLKTVGDVIAYAQKIRPMSPREQAAAFEEYQAVVKTSPFMAMDEVTRAEVEENVKNVIGRHFKMSKEEIAEKIRPEKNLAEHLGADSLDAVEIVIDLGDVYPNLDISDRAMEDLHTVGDIMHATIKGLEAIPSGHATTFIIEKGLPPGRNNAVLMGAGPRTVATPS